MAYFITYTEPRYDNRDAIVGSRTRVVEGLPTYETIGMAFAKRDELEARDAQYGDINFDVRDCAAPRVIAKRPGPVIEHHEELPF